MPESISRRQFVMSAAAGAAALSLPGLLTADRSPKRRRPNVILIYADDLGYGDLSCYGSKKIATPHLDALASRGIRFTDFLTMASICTPSRTALLTGCYPQRAGLYMGISPKRPKHQHLGLHPGEVTVAETLRGGGYATLCVGKWHLGFDEVFHPLNHGFDEYYGMWCNYRHSPVCMEGRKIVDKQTDLTTLTDRYTARTVDFIRRKKDKPFFIYLSHNAPHLPLKPSPKFKGSSKVGAYGDVVQEMDAGVGEILKTLKELKLEDDTLVIFTSDNGPVGGPGGIVGSPGPLRGNKGTSYEGGQRVPFIAAWPGHIPAGKTCGELACTMDMMPTIAAAAGTAMPKDRVIDGRDIRPLLTGAANAKSPHDILYYYNCDHLQAVRWKQWKLHLPRTPNMVPWWQRRRGLRSLKTPLLYDLGKDIGERRDVAGAHADVVKHMLTLAEKARAELGDFGRRGSGQRPTGDSRKLNT